MKVRWIPGGGVLDAVARLVGSGENRLALAGRRPGGGSSGSTSDSVVHDRVGGVIITVGADADRAEEVLGAADRVLQGVNHLRHIRAGALSFAASASVDSNGWEDRIHDALENDKFELYLQPIVEVESGEIVQYEALLRMRGREGLILPGHFLGEAERLNLMDLIDTWVVCEAIRALGSDSQLHLAVNLSTASMDNLFLDLIRYELDAHGVEPDRLVLEITETAAIAHMDDAQSFARSLSELGCAFALDDFGAGFSSFYYLKHLPADILKIDGGFIRGPRSETDELVITAIVDVAQGLDKQTIAEFVESEEDLDAVRAQGIDLAQGFHLGRPRPLEEVLWERRE